MAYEKKPFEWKASGALPPQSLRDEGFKAGQKLPADYINSQWTTNYEAISELQTKTQEHYDNKANPHGVTKAQVGLSNVLNYGIATVAEAEAGTSDAKYMTPLKTKSVIDKLMSTLNSSIATHIANVSNPHGVTKAQVGLGGVQNYGIATEAEAKAGTSDVKYMTPFKVKSAVDEAVTPVNSTINSHTSNVSNPHNVTKEQVGLGNVQNYGIATAAEAQTGVSDTKYMTPLKTKNAIDILGAALENALNHHLLSAENPHKVTKAQVGLGNVQNYNIATGAEALAGESNAAYMTPSLTKAQVDNILATKTATYGTGTLNPNTTTETVIITKHANTPFGADEFCFIVTIFYSNRETGHATQMAFSYTKTPTVVYTRSRFQAVWSPWVQLETTAGAQEKVDTHANRTDNPHGVTKAQVGLANVPNFAMGTAAEAEAGTAGNKLMSPALTKIAFNKFIAPTNAHVNDTVIHTPYGTCLTAAATAAKTVSDALLGDFALVEGASIRVKFSNSNTASAPTLDVAVTGAKPLLKPNGQPFTNIVAGSVYTFVYSGSAFIVQGEGGEYGTVTAADVYYESTFGTESGVVQGTNPYRQGVELTELDLKAGSGTIGSTAKSITAHDGSAQRFKLVTDNNNNVYSARISDAAPTTLVVKKYNNLLNEVWSTNITITRNGTAVIAQFDLKDNALFVAINNYPRIVKVSLAGAVLFNTTISHGTTFMNASFTNTKGYAVLFQTGSASTVAIYNSAGTLQRTIASSSITGFPTYAGGIGMDEDGNFYVNANSGYLFKYTQAGVKEWQTTGTYSQITGFWDIGTNIIILAGTGATVLNKSSRASLISFSASCGIWVRDSVYIATMETNTYAYVRSLDDSSFIRSTKMPAYGAQAESAAFVLTRDGNVVSLDSDRQVIRKVRLVQSYVL